MHILWDGFTLFESGACQTERGMGVDAGSGVNVGGDIIPGPMSAFDGSAMDCPRLQLIPPGSLPEKQMVVIRSFMFMDLLPL